MKRGRKRGRKAKLSVIKIEKRIPLPPRLGTRGSQYPVEQMKVGDSFLIPPGKQPSAAMHLAKRLKFKLASRKINDQYRVWRVK